MNKPRHILIGGAGFLGLEITEQLILKNNKFRDAQQVVILDKEFSRKTLSKLKEAKVKTIKVDISQPHELEKVSLYKNDIVHHLASNLIIPNKPRFNRYTYFSNTTVDGTNLLLNWMSKNGCTSLIFWSTDMVYGYVKSAPVTEAEIPAPLGPYGKTKVIAENMILNAVAEQGLKATIFRPRLIIGPGRLGILTKLFKLIETNLPVPIIGPGNNRFQFVGVSDCANASIMAAQLGCPSGIFNLGSSKPPTTKSLLNEFIKRVGSKSKVLPMNSFFIKSVLKRLNTLGLSPMDPEQFRIADQDAVVDIQKVKNKLRWTPVQDDLEMLLSAYETYREQKN